MVVKFIYVMLCYVKIFVFLLPMKICIKSLDYKYFVFKEGCFFVDLSYLLIPCIIHNLTLLDIFASFLKLYWINR